MSDIESNKLEYSAPVIDFVAVSVEFCAFLEKEELPARGEWVEKMLKLLPLLYLKALLLPAVDLLDEEPSESFVKETDYVRVAGSVARIMAEEDTFLDVFVEDMKYSDMPVSAFVSESVADIYQDVRNFVSVYQYELSEQMLAAVAMVNENFKHYWGQKLVNVLRPLHALHCAQPDVPMEDEEFNEEDVWG